VGDQTLLSIPEARYRHSSPVPHPGSLPRQLSLTHHFRLDLVSFNLAIRELANSRFSSDADFIAMVFTMHNEGCLASEISQHVSDWLQQIFSVEACKLDGGPGRIGQWPEKMKAVRIPISLRGTKACLVAGWKDGANRKANPNSCKHASALSGGRA